MNQEWKALKESFQMGVVSLWIISMPILVCMLLYTEALVRLVFQHGQFDEKATSMVTQVLVFLAFSMLPYFARDSITRVFYAFQDSKTPLTVGMISIITKAFLDWLLVVQLPFGVGGIAFSTTLMTFINMTLLGILSKRHIQDLGFKEMSLPFVKLTLAALVMAFFMVGLTNVMHPTLHGWFAGFLPRIAEILEILLMVSLGMGVYLAAILALKVPEAQYLYERLGSRFKRKLS
jgi:putative peptidoglycan lipid II flippase